MCSKQSNKPDNKVVCAGQGTVDATGSLTATPNPEVSSVLSEIDEYSRTATQTKPTDIATSYSEIEQEGPKTSVPPPWERTMESSLYTSLYSEASTISVSATITFAPTTTTAGLPVYNGTSSASPPVFTGAAGRVAVGGSGVVGGIVAALALL